MPGYTGGCLWTNFEGFFKAIDDFSINTAWNDVLGNKTDSPVVIQVRFSCCGTCHRQNRLCRNHEPLRCS
ncbi:hypothetical protein C4A70_00003 [Escherichia coli]|nr:hypothetical protein C4A70_00003 [Escherichia coli]